jgi:hypothetical protein
MANPKQKKAHAKKEYNIKTNLPPGFAMQGYKVGVQDADNHK